MVIVIVHSCLSLSMGLQGVAAGLRARAGYSLDKSPAHRRALTDEQCGVQYLAQGHFNMQLSPRAGIWTSNLPITGRPALPAELQPP